MEQAVPAWATLFFSVLLAISARKIQAPNHRAILLKMTARLGYKLQAPFFDS
jgi:hypothetical protein